MIIATVTALALILMLTGLIIKNAMLLLSSIIPWIIFAFLMFNYTFDNTAIGAALLVFGGSMALISSFMALNIYMSRKPTRQNVEDEQTLYKKQVLNATRRRGTK